MKEIVKRKVHTPLCGNNKFLVHSFKVLGFDFRILTTQLVQQRLLRRREILIGKLFRNSPKSLHFQISSQYSVI